MFPFVVFQPLLKPETSFMRFAVHVIKVTCIDLDVRGALHSSKNKYGSGATEIQLLWLLGSGLERRSQDPNSQPFSEKPILRCPGG